MSKELINSLYIHMHRKTPRTLNSAVTKDGRRRRTGNLFDSKQQ